MYAIVKTGGKQYKVAEGDVISIEKLTAAPGEEVAFPAILFVDGDEVTHDPAALAQVAVTAEVVAQTKGPKIRIHKYKNKTGYHKRMGHRQKLTEVRILSVGTGRPTTGNSTAATAAPAQPAAEAPVAAAVDAPAATTVEAPAPAETVTPAPAATVTPAPVETVAPVPAETVSPAPAAETVVPAPEASTATALEEE